MSHYVSFGAWVRRQRKILRISQQELAHRVKKPNGESVSAAYIGAIENDRARYGGGRYTLSRETAKQLLAELATITSEEWVSWATGGPAPLDPEAMIQGRREADGETETAFPIYPPAPVPAAIVDHPGTALSLVHFSYDPYYDRGSLQLVFCTEKRYYRLRSVERTPKAEVLFDRIFPMEAACDFRWPATQLVVGDVVEICLGVGDTPEEASATLRVYRIRRSEQGIILDGIFDVEVA